MRRITEEHGPVQGLAGHSGHAPAELWLLRDNPPPEFAGMVRCICPTASLAPPGTSSVLNCPAHGKVPVQGWRVEPAPALETPRESIALEQEVMVLEGVHLRWPLPKPPKSRTRHPKFGTPGIYRARKDGRFHGL